MLKISAEMMASMAQRRGATEEVPWIAGELRQGYDEILKSLDDAALHGNVRACLDRCNALGLQRPVDRFGLCALDIVGFPGFRDLPQLPSLVARYADEPESVLLELMAEAPAKFWTHLLTQSEPVRRERGML